MSNKSKTCTHKSNNPNFKYTDPAFCIMVVLLISFIFSVIFAINGTCLSRVIGIDDIVHINQSVLTKK